MDAFLVVIAGVAAYLLWFIFGKKSKNEDLSDNMPPMPPQSQKPIVARLRRRRLSGGFYPIGYSGIFLPGEDLVEELLWMAALAAMTEDELDELGEYGGEDYVEVEDPRESAEFVTEPVEEAPEAEEFVELDPVSEPTPAPEPTSEPEPVEDDTKRSGWGDGVDSDLSDSFGSDDSDSGGWDSDD